MHEILYKQALEEGLDRICRFLGFVIIPVVAGSVTRIWATGWLSLYALHLILPAIVITLSYYRKSISFNIKANSLLGLSYVVVVASMVQFSFASFATGYLFLMVLMARIFLGSVGAWLYFALCLATLCVFGYLTLGGAIVPPVDTSRYQTLTIAWVNILVSFVLVMAMIVMAASNVSEVLLEKSWQLEADNLKVAAAIDEIRKLRATIPICGKCNQVRDDDGFWQGVEEYLGTHKNMDLTHSVCNDCIGQLYPEVIVINP